MFQRRSSLPEGTLTEYDLIARACRAEAKVKVLYPAPCSGCPYTNTCARRKVACSALVRYVRKGYAVRRKGVVPTERWYRKLFSDCGAMIADRARGGLVESTESAELTSTLPLIPHQQSAS
jgi:hypothetical protein